MWGLPQWLSRLLGVEDEHVWWCYQFDAAVSHLGRTIESKLNMTDSKGNRVHTLDTLLAPSRPQGKVIPINEAAAFFASKGRGIKVSKG